MSKIQTDMLNIEDRRQADYLWLVERKTFGRMAGKSRAVGTQRGNINLMKSWANRRALKGPIGGQDRLVIEGCETACHLLATPLFWRSNLRSLRVNRPQDLCNPFDALFTRKKPADWT
jgi:hypothetical protein